MIGYLEGTVIIRDDPYLVVNVSGVGYRVHAVQDVLSISKTGLNTKVFTYTYVREDEISLYGFLKYSDLKLFESLINVSGIGPRTAIAIFAKGNSEQITNAIVGNDVGFFSGVPRLGTKNAQKIIIELKSKIGGGELDLSDGMNMNKNEVSAALKTFGFSSNEISEAVRNIDSAKPVEAQIKEALKYLGK